MTDYEALVAWPVGHNKFNEALGKLSDQGLALAADYFQQDERRYLMKLMKVRFEIRNRADMCEAAVTP